MTQSKNTEESFGSKKYFTRLKEVQVSSVSSGIKTTIMCCMASCLLIIFIYISTNEAINAPFIESLLPLNSETSFVVNSEIQI